MDQPWKTYRERLLWAMQAAKKTNQSALAREVGIRPQSVQHLLDATKNAQGSSHTPGLAAALNVSAHWLATGEGSPSSGGSTSLPGVAHQVSLQDRRLPPPLILWKIVMQSEQYALPPVFEVAAPDDALAPDVRTGQIVKVTIGQEATPGDGVLLRDSAGAHYLRRYRQRRDGQWTAFSLNLGFEDMHSDRDGLELLGVVSIERRLSQ